MGNCASRTACSLSASKPRYKASMNALRGSSRHCTPSWRARPPARADPSDRRPGSPRRAASDH
eukprot:978298-Prorocentrum_lima.AAC.1